MPLLKDGWQSNSTSIPTLRMEEQPPSLIKQLINQRYEPLQFLQHILSSSIVVNGKETSFITLLENTININMKNRHPGQQKQSIYHKITETETYKLLAIKLMQGLDTRGKTKHVDKGLYEEVHKYIGVNRTKV